jgi:hypothetical protein
MIVSLFIGMIMMAVLIYIFRGLFLLRVYPPETIQRIMDSIVQQSEYISTIQSPQIALIHSRECQASLATLLRLVGAQSTVDSICGIDTEHLQNILYFQEKQIHSYLQMMDQK